MGIDGWLCLLAPCRCRMLPRSRGACGGLSPVHSLLNKGTSALPALPQDVMNLIVVNESKLRRAPVAPKLPLIEASVSFC